MIPRPTDIDVRRAAWRAANQVPGVERSWSVTNAGTSTRLYVNGVIGGHDDDASTFVQEVHAITASVIDLHVNSPGGFVWDAISMYEALRSHPAKVRTHIDGLAASAASFLALAGDQVEIARAGRVMIHDAQVVGMGSPADLREAADVGDAVSNDIAGLYADRAGGTAAGWRKAMTAVTWYSAQVAVDAGLAHRVAGGTTGPDNRSRLILARHRALTTQGG